MGEREGTSLFTTATTHVGQWRCKIVVMRSWVKTWTVQKIKTQSDNVMNVHDPDPPHFTVASWTILTPILNTFFHPECCCLHICRILKVGYAILVKSLVFLFFERHNADQESWRQTHLFLRIWYCNLFTEQLVLAVETDLTGFCKVDWFEDSTKE